MHTFYGMYTLQTILYRGPFKQGMYSDGNLCFLKTLRQLLVKYLKSLFIEELRSCCLKYQWHHYEGLRIVARRFQGT